MHDPLVEQYVVLLLTANKYVLLGDRDPNTFGLLGYCLEKMGNVVPAEMAYMEALAGDPTNGDWMEGLLRIYIQGKQVARAESLVKNLIKARPTEARFWLTYANILLVDHRKLEAIALLETAVGTGVAGVDEMNLLADLYAEQKLIPEAVAIYQKVLVPGSRAGRAEAPATCRGAGRRPPLAAGRGCPRQAAAAAHSPRRNHLPPDPSRHPGRTEEMG